MEMLSKSVGLSEIFDNLEQDAAKLWKFVDECKTSYKERESGGIQASDAVRYIKHTRKMHKSSLDSLHDLQALAKTINDGTMQLEQTVQKLEDHISRTALNYGLRLIPDEVLAEIFVKAVEKLEEKVALSLVCRRFRAIIMPMRKLWDEYYLEIGQTPEEMVAITEGNRFVLSKATVTGRCRAYWPDTERRARVYGRVFGSNRYRYEDQFFKQSLDFILSLRLEQLHIIQPDGNEEEIRRIPDSVAMQSARTLVLRVNCNSIRDHLEGRHIPLVQNLETDGVPGLTVGINLIRCKLFIDHVDGFDALREFLASANSLKYLLLHSSSPGWMRFNQPNYLPSLRSLEVNCIPCPPFARHLTQLTQFTFRHDCVTLAELLEFLSSTKVLRVLSIHVDAEFHHGTDNVLQEVTLPSLMSCKIIQRHYGAWIDLSLFGPVLVSKLRMPALQRLEVRYSRPEDQESDGFLSIGIFNDYLPPNFPHQRFIRFERCRSLPAKFVKTVVGYIAGIEGMSIEFDHSRGWRSGVFRPDEIESALEKR